MWVVSPRLGPVACPSFISLRVIRKRGKNGFYSEPRHVAYGNADRSGFGERYASADDGARNYAEGFDA